MPSLLAAGPARMCAPGRFASPLKTRVGGLRVSRSTRARKNRMQVAQGRRVARGTAIKSVSGAHETGLVYYGQRYYSPALGRFINQDPIQEAGGLNLYAFCGNDGVNRYDVLGMDDPFHPMGSNDGTVWENPDNGTLTYDRKALSPGDKVLGAGTRDRDGVDGLAVRDSDGARQFRPGSWSFEQNQCGDFPQEAADQNLIAPNNEMARSVIAEPARATADAKSSFPYRGPAPGGCMVGAIQNLFHREASVDLTEDQVIAALMKIGNRTREDVLKGSTFGQALAAINQHLNSYGYTADAKYVKSVDDFTDYILTRSAAVVQYNRSGGHAVTYDIYENVIYDGTSQDLAIPVDSAKQLYYLMGDDTGRNKAVLILLPKS